MRALLLLCEALVVVLVACGATAPRPAPSSSSGPAAAPQATSASGASDTPSEADQPTLDEAPKLGFLERRADGTCWYGTSPSGPLQRVLACPPTMFDASQKSPPTEDPPSGGWLEKVVDAGTCWWSLHAPYDCPPGAVCKPDPPVSRVRCP